MSKFRINTACIFLGFLLVGANILSGLSLYRCTLSGDICLTPACCQLDEANIDTCCETDKPNCEEPEKVCCLEIGFSQNPDPALLENSKISLKKVSLDFFEFILPNLIADQKILIDVKTNSPPGYILSGTTKTRIHQVNCLYLC